MSTCFKEGANHIQIEIDGKHSYEDAIIPVQDFQARYGDRIAVLGGIDLNILAAGTPDAPARIRKHARFLMETCGARPVRDWFRQLDPKLCAAAELPGDGG